jgi:hypothetical protein
VRLFRALYAFYRTLFSSNCEHKSVSGSSKKGNFCPDCGYRIKLLWNLCRCKTCGARRTLSRALDGWISPKERHCSHCGDSAYQLVQKEQIHGYELPYATLTREIDYLDQCINANFQKNQLKDARFQSPFKSQYFDIVEGVLINKVDI